MIQIYNLNVNFTVVQAQNLTDIQSVLTLVNPDTS
jgi:hypothetical protein